MHRHPPRDRARARWPTPSSRRSPRGWRRSPSATPRTTTSGWARWPASSSARRSARRSSRCAPPPRSCFGDPDHVDVVDGDAERGAFLVARAAARHHGRGRAARRRAVRPGVAPCSPTTPSTRPSSWRPAARASLVGSLVTHDPDVARAVDARRGPLARPDPGPRPRRRGGVDRPRLAAADAGARRPRPGRRRRGARRRPRRAPPHAAHRGPGLARHDDRDHRPLDDRLAARTTAACTRSARASPSCAIGDTIALRAAHGHARGHRALRGVHRRHVLRPHRPRGGGAEPALRRHRRPRLPRRLAGGRAVRRPRPGPGAGQLRRRPACASSPRSRPATRSR